MTWVTDIIFVGGCSVVAGKAEKNRFRGEILTREIPTRRVGPAFVLLHPLRPPFRSPHRYLLISSLKPPQKCSNPPPDPHLPQHASVPVLAPSRSTPRQS